MELPTIQRGKRKLVKINEGQVFLLKSRVPHSPQRPEAGSLGLVIERSRCARPTTLKTAFFAGGKVYEASVQGGAVVIRKWPNIGSANLSSCPRKGILFTSLWQVGR